MSDTFAALTTRPLSRGALIHQTPDAEIARVGLEDAASHVMTDLRRVPAVTTPRETLVDEALQKMIHAKVRLLLVVDDRCGVHGVVTARDLVGEAPVKVARQEGLSRDGVAVRQVMTPLEEVDVLTMDQVDQARVGDIVETLRKAARQHLLVVDCDEYTCDHIRGIFSATQIGRHLGLEISPEGPAQSFAELERLLQRH